ncbi:MbnP family protein [Pontimicrobium sp. MEBiC01747]
MKKIFILLIAAAISFTSCGEDNDDNIKASAKTSLRFSHNWDGTSITNADFENTEYTNANGEVLTITRLRYLISNVTFTKTNGEKIVINGHNLIDVTNNNRLTYNLDTNIPTGTYTNVSFTFGFNNEDNAENYTDLNSENFNVPAMMGGGYHYMQFDGKFTNASNTEQGFNYHAIRAVDNPGMNPTFPQDTFFNVDLGAVSITNDATIEVKANLAEWFKNPNTWDLNVLNQMLMPNSAAQIMMNANGKNGVFTLGEITQ